MRTVVAYINLASYDLRSLDVVLARNAVVSWHSAGDGQVGRGGMSLGVR